MSSLFSRVVLEVDQDFSDIWAAYEPHRWLKSPTASRTDLRIAHRFAYSIVALVRAVPKSWPEHRRIFLEETASDAVHLLHSLFCGDARGTDFYLRSVLENFLRHLYFKDHPVEYGWLHERSAYFLSIEELRLYAKNVQVLAGNLKRCLDSLIQAYSGLSRVVHSSTAPTLALRKTLAEIGLTKAESGRVAADIRRFGRDLVLLLFVLHDDLVQELPVERRRLLVDFLDKPRKRLRLKGP